MTPHNPLAALSDHLATLAAAGAARAVSVQGREGRGFSGILWQEGLVVTAAEPLERDDDITVTLPDGRRVQATLAGRDTGTDVALLKLETGPVAPLEPAPPESLALGRLALAVGRGEAGPIAAMGVAAFVGGAWRSMRGGSLERRLVFDLRLSALAEGGPLLDDAGRLIGMAVFGPRRRPLAIPAETIARVVEVLRTRGRVARGYLGLAMQPVRTGATRGLIVLGVDPGSPAAQAGVLLGDVLLAMDSQPLAGVREMLGRLDPDSVGRPITLEVQRAGQALSLALVVGERPAASRQRQGDPAAPRDDDPAAARGDDPAAPRNGDPAAPRSGDPAAPRQAG